MCFVQTRHCTINRTLEIHELASYNCTHHDCAESICNHSSHLPSCLRCIATSPEHYTVRTIMLRVGQQGWAREFRGPCRWRLHRLHARRSQWAVWVAGPVSLRKPHLRPQSQDSALSLHRAILGIHSAHSRQTA